MIERIDLNHLALGSILCLLAVLSLFCDWDRGLSLVIAGILSIYIITLLIECAHRSSKSTGNVFYGLPNRGWAILLVMFMVGANVFSFANVYKQSGSIEIETEGKITTLEERTDAIYFSAVTVTTLGYGDFTPKPSGRLYIVFQLASGLLLLLITIPVVAARISSWE